MNIQIFPIVEMNSWVQRKEVSSLIKKQLSISISQLCFKRGNSILQHEQDYY